MDTEETSYRPEPSAVSDGSETVEQLPSVEFDTEIVMETPVVRPASQPQNVKQEDSVLNKTKWTRDEVKLMVRCIDNYIEKE